MKPVNVKKPNTVAAVTKKVTTMIVHRAVDLIFNKYSNELLTNSKLEKILTKCEDYKLISIGMLFSQNTDTKKVVRGILAIVANPWYERFLNFIVKTIM